MSTFTRSDLESFMTSFLLPPDADLKEFLRWSEDYMNRPAEGRQPPDVVEIGSADDWQLRLSIFGGQPDGSKPVIFHSHGGAWIAGTHTSHRGLACELADRGFLVVGIDYRRAPKHRFPAGLTDVSAGLKWVTQNIADHGGDPQRIALLGDSAGSNLAAALAADPDGYDGVSAAAFLYGIFDFERAFPVMSRLIGPTPDIQQYLPVYQYDELVDDPRVSPINITDWPVPIYIGCGTLDPMIDQSRMLRDRLAELGVEHEYREFDDAPHSYVQILGNPNYEAGIDSLADFFHRHLG